MSDSAQPLWTDELIYNSADALPYSEPGTPFQPSVLLLPVYGLLKRMRDEYEAARQQDAMRIKELEANLATVSRALMNTDGADRWIRGHNAGFDAAYTQGQARITELEAQLVEARQWEDVAEESVEVPDDPSWILHELQYENGEKVEIVLNNYVRLQRRVATKEE